MKPFFLFFLCCLAASLKGQNVTVDANSFSPQELIEDILIDSDCITDVVVTNTGTRRGSEVVQAYVEPIAPALQRPVRELKAFRKVTLDPGESTTVTLALDARAFAVFDPGDPVYGELAANSLVPAGTGGSHREEPGWYVEGGHYRVHVGRSSRTFAGVCDVTLDGDLRMAP